LPLGYSSRLHQRLEIELRKVSEDS
jgi:hypothetical protein